MTDDAADQRKKRQAAALQQQMEKELGDMMQAAMKEGIQQELRKAHKDGRLRLAHLVLGIALNLFQSVLAFANANELSFVDVSTNGTSSAVAAVCGPLDDWPAAHEDVKGYGVSTAILATCGCFLILSLIGMRQTTKKMLASGNIFAAAGTAESKLEKFSYFVCCTACLAMGTGVAALVKLIQFTVDINDIDEICVQDGSDYQRLNDLKWVFWGLQIFGISMSVAEETRKMCTKSTRDRVAPDGP